MQVLADRLGKPAASGGSGLLMPAPAAVNITASAQLRDLPPLGFALPPLSPAALQPRYLPAHQPESTHQQSHANQGQRGVVAPAQHQPHGDGAGLRTTSCIGGRCGRFISGVSEGSSVTAAGSSELPRMQPADDSAILSQHAAAINASLVAAGSRLAAGSSGVSSSSRALAHGPGSRGPLSDGGVSTTASMHSATSGGGYAGAGSRSGASTPRSAWQSPQPGAPMLHQASGAGSTASGTEFADEPLLDAGGNSSSGGLLGSLQAPHVPDVLLRNWRALKRYVGS